MGFFSSLFGSKKQNNRWINTLEYLEQEDCSGNGHKIRLMKGKEHRFYELRVYPNQNSFNLLKSECTFFLIMRFSVNGKLIPNIYNMLPREGYFVTPGSAIDDFEYILENYGTIQVTLISNTDTSVNLGSYTNDGFI